MSLTFGSLFAGIGGFDLGFERAGMECRWQVEIDDYANRILAKHWPDVRRHQDICTFPTEPVDDWRVDVICGGFPCQDISNAGKRIGIKGQRSSLFFEAMRVVCVLEPRYVVLENVAALLDRGMDQVLGAFAEIGFDAEWHCVPACAIGAPHIRDRIFILANSNEQLRSSRESTSTTRGDDDRARSAGAHAGEVANADVSRSPKRKGKKPGRPGADERTEPASGSWWCVESNVGRVVDGFPGRVDRIRCLGNAVVPQVAEWIGRAIVHHEDQR